MNFYDCGISGNSSNFAGNSKSCRQNFLGVGYLTSHKSFDFGVDTDHHPESEIFNGFFSAG